MAEKKPSPRQQKAANRASALYHSNMDWVPDKRYRELMQPAPKGGIAGPGPSLMRALGMAQDVPGSYAQAYPAGPDTARAAIVAPFIDWRSLSDFLKSRK